VPHSYNYDAAGNRAVADSLTYTSNNLNQYQQIGGITYTYDETGNLEGDGTRTYTYDENNQLTGVSGGGLNVTYSYDALGRRVRKTSSSGTVVYRYDGSDVLEEIEHPGTVLASYVGGSQIDETLTMTRAGTTYHLFPDGTNSVSDVAIPSGALYESHEFDPYGRPMPPSSAGNPYLFAGREYELDTGLYYSRHRHYNPTLGRFMQRDPLGYADG
jgi:RHS repeat-associated protein